MARDLVLYFLLLLRFGPRIWEDDDVEDANSMYGGTSQEDYIANEESELQKFMSTSGDGLDGKVSRKNTRYFPSLR